MRKSQVGRNFRPNDTPTGMGQIVSISANHIERYICAWLLALSLPAGAAKLIDAPPPPQLPAAELGHDGAPKKPGLVETPGRGQLLYENHCTSCHESVLHIRARHTVRSLPELRAQVERWAANSKLSWGKEEIDEVVHFLNSRHYGF